MIFCCKLFLFLDANNLIQTRDPMAAFLAWRKTKRIKNFEQELEAFADLKNFLQEKGYFTITSKFFNYI